MPGHARYPKARVRNLNFAGDLIATMLLLLSAKFGDLALLKI